MDDEIIYKKCDICGNDDNRPVYEYVDKIRRCDPCANRSTALHRKDNAKIRKLAIVGGPDANFFVY